MINLEIWLPIKEIEGYFISNYGRLRSDKGNKPIILKTKIIPSGYEQITLNNKGTKVYRYIHRLVAEVFVDNPNNLPWVNHIDGVKTHNYATNLEWVVPSENSKHAFRHGLNKITDQQRRDFVARTRLLLGKKVEQLTIDGKVVREWDNACDSQRELGFDRANIATACRKGVIRYGYRWKYVSKSALGEASM